VINVKICGLTNRDDAEMALGLGADAVGFVFEPSSPRYVGDNSDIIRFVGSVAPYSFCIAVYGSVNKIYPGFQAVQFEQEGDAVNATGPLPAGILTLRFTPDTTVDNAVEAAKVHLRNRKTFPIRGIHIEAYHADQMGGTGQQLDLNFATTFVAKCPSLVTLSGGLNPDNVGRAIQLVHPYAVDVSSGIEEKPGVKSPIMMRDFIQAARGAANAVGV
jgi:phosphoribosylanthranilate isomerase